MLTIMSESRWLSGESQVVHPEGVDLNTIFQTLADWEHQLKALEQDIPKDIETEIEEPSP
jgi:hypothetical protein